MKIPALVALCLLVSLPALACARQEPPAPTPAPAAAAPAAEPPAKVEAPAAPALVEIVPGLPDFPGAALVSTEERGPHDGWARTWKRETSTRSAWREVRAFYAKQIQAAGWEVRRTREKVDEIEWEMVKGTSWAQVEVDADSWGLVKIKIERRDR